MMCWAKRVALRCEPPYAWYLRVPDVPAFIRHIAPVLERRLARSILTGYTGDLKVDFYNGGLRLHFEQGKIDRSRTLARPGLRRRSPCRLPAAGLPAVALRLSQSGRAACVFAGCVDQPGSNFARQHLVSQATVRRVPAQQCMSEVTLTVSPAG